MPSEAPALLHVFSTFAPGGPQVRTVGLMRELGDAFRHVVVPMDGRTDARSLLPADFPLELEPRPSARGTLGMVRELRALVRRRRPDRVCTYNWGAIEAVMAARSAGVPVLHHEDGFLPDEAGGFKARRVWTRRLVLRGVERLIVPSRTLEGIATGLWRLPASRVRYVPNGIEVPPLPSDEERRAARRSFGLPEDDPAAVVIGAVGHLRREKNYARLMSAFGRLPVSEAVRPYLLLLGDGDERKDLGMIAKRMDMRTRIVLAGHHEDLAPAYAAMDLFAISSDTEQMPIALLEAMAAELPVVSTDVGDVRAMLPPGQGELVVPIQEADGDDRTTIPYAAALARLLEDAGLRKVLGQANRLRVAEEFGRGPMVDAYREAWSGPPRG